MAEQDIDFFDYVNEKSRPPLLNKGAYIDESFLNYIKQINFDKNLTKPLNLNEDILISITDFEKSLLKQKLKITNHSLKNMSKIYIQPPP